MTNHASLERRYRRLLAFYPRAFRRESGAELIGVLMAGARHGQRWPGLAASADLITSGLRPRLRPSVPRSATTVRAAVRLMHAGAAVTKVSLIAAIISVALVGLATLQLFGEHGIVQLIFAVVTWLIGAAAVWLLWRPASNTFFSSQDFTHAGHGA